MPRSMTGLGQARRDEERRSWSCELRSVNHRHLEIRINLSAELQPLQALIEGAIRRRLSRGRIDGFVQASSAGEAPIVPQLDLARARGYREAYSTLARALGLADEIPLTVIASAPGVLRASEPHWASDQSRALVEELVQEAVTDLERMREAEGSALAGELEAHLGAVAALFGRIKSEIPRAIAEKQRRLDERLSALLGEQRLDPGRLAQEVAVLVDRADVTEELERLESHCAQFTRVLSDPEPVGRKLDFLLQEMNRETNTIGSKCADAAIAHLVVDLKLELERLREQVQNLE
ncbi:MAG: YicC family protein [Deltaproteobacteria bacterium]|nr:YicC family protein [Deltaproteobacteria bacterium]